MSARWNSLWRSAIARTIYRRLTLFNLAQRDERLHLARSMFLGLAEWGGSSRRLNVTQAVEQLLYDMTEPMTIAAINAKTRRPY